MTAPKMQLTCDDFLKVDDNDASTDTGTGGTCEGLNAGGVWSAESSPGVGGGKGTEVGVCNCILVSSPSPVGNVYYISP